MAFTHRQYDVTNPYHPNYGKSGFKHKQHDKDHPEYIGNAPSDNSKNKPDKDTLDDEEE